MKIALISKIKEVCVGKDVIYSKGSQALSKLDVKYIFSLW